MLYFANPTRYMYNYTIEKSGYDLHSALCNLIVTANPILLWCHRAGEKGRNITFIRLEYSSMIHSDPKQSKIGFICVI